MFLDVLMRMEQEKKELLKNINEKERKLNAQFAEVMAVMPATTGHAFSGSPITVQVCLLLIKDCTRVMARRHSHLATDNAWQRQMHCDQYSYCGQTVILDLAFVNVVEWS